MAVNTKKAERRSLSFASLDEVSAELDRLEWAHASGKLRHTGNWSAGQIFEHLAIFMRCAMDGFPADGPPAVVRWLMVLLIKPFALRGARPPAGITLPSKASFLLPEPEVTFDEGLGELRGQIARVRGGERWTKPRPVFGRLTHEQWTTLHLGHCALHLGFLHPE